MGSSSAHTFARKAWHHALHCNLLMITLAPLLLYFSYGYPHCDERIQKQRHPAPPDTCSDPLVQQQGAAQCRTWTLDMHGACKCRPGMLCQPFLQSVDQASLQLIVQHTVHKHDNSQCKNSAINCHVLASADHTGYHYANDL